MLTPLYRILAYLLIFIVLLLVIHLINEDQQEQQFRQALINHSQQSIQILEELIQSKREQTTLVALNFAHNPNVIKGLHEQKIHDLAFFKNYLNELKRYTPMQNAWIQLIDVRGVSIYRSWTGENGDSLMSDRTDIQQVLTHPQKTETISIGKYDLTFKTITPVWQNQRLLGLVEVITKFNSVTKKLKEKGGDALILVNEAYHSQLIQPFTGKFIQNYYIANTNASQEIINYTQQKRLYNLDPNLPFYVDPKTQKLIVFYNLKNAQLQSLARFFIAYDLNNVLPTEPFSDQSDYYLVAGLMFLTFLGVYLNSASRPSSAKTKNLLASISRKTAIQVNDLETFFASTINSLNMPICLYDIHGKSVLTNAAWKELMPASKQSTHYLQQTLNSGDSQHWYETKESGGAIEYRVLPIRKEDNILLGAVEVVCPQTNGDIT